MANFGLMGSDPAVLPLIRAIVESPHDALTIAANAGPLGSEVLAMCPGLRITSPDELLTRNDLDAVLVCGANEDVMEAAKKLAGTCVPVVVVPHAEQGLTWIYELGLIRDDCGVKLLPLFPHAFHPALTTVMSEVREGRLGDLQHLAWERDSESDAGTFSSKHVHNALLHDASLLRHICGEFSQVTALHSGTGDEQISTATVTLAGHDLPGAVWTIKRADRAGWRLVINGSTGRRVLHGGAEPHTIGMDDEEPTPADVGPEMLSHVKTGLAEDTGAWMHLVRTFEIVDAERRSIKRRRTIDLHFETTSERNLFKSQMTAIGCGVLLLTLFGVVGLLIAAAVLDRRPKAEVNAANADSILYTAEFLEAEAQLTAPGQTHVGGIALRMGMESFQVLIEKSESVELDRGRRATVMAALQSQGIPADEAARRTEIVKLTGPWLKQAMQIARFAVFAPLFLFLALQGLLVLTRPAS